MLQIRSVSKTYIGKVTSTEVLRDVSLSIGCGELCALTGPSGSGKTTLMNLVGLLDRPSSGEIAVAGNPTNGLSSDQLAQLRNSVLGFVFQSFHLLTRMNALENVALPLLYRGVNLVERRRRAGEAL